MSSTLLQTSSHLPLQPQTPSQKNPPPDHYPAFQFHSGRRHTIPALDISVPDVRATYETNVFGPMRMVQAFSSLLISAQGLVVNISSNSTLGPYLFGSIFASSKAAINTYSRALRLELQPFRVRVMLAMMGTVRSDVASHAHAYRDLPQKSVYFPIEDLFKKRLTYSQNASTMPTAEYARKLVKAALCGPGSWDGWIGGTPDVFWGGGMATTSWVTTWLPDWVTDILTGRFFGLPVIVRRIREAADGNGLKRA